jgi:hypothetical protein
MFDSQRDYGLESVELSDDELDLIAGGIPHDDRDPAFGSMIYSEPLVTSTQTRPTEDPGLWY